MKNSIRIGYICNRTEKKVSVHYICRIINGKAVPYKDTYVVVYDDKPELFTC